jgi:Arc/MetJ-type ribon-helix-helix transcriptional regulator
MTKQKISITIDEGQIKTIEDLLKSGLFRNRSHLIEYSLKKFLINNKQKNQLNLNEFGN